MPQRTLPQAGWGPHVLVLRPLGGRARAAGGPPGSAGAPRVLGHTVPDDSEQQQQLCPPHEGAPRRTSVLERHRRPNPELPLRVVGEHSKCSPTVSGRPHSSAPSPPSHRHSSASRAWGKAFNDQWGHHTAPFKSTKLSSEGKHTPDLPGEGAAFQLAGGGGGMFPGPSEGSGGLSIGGMGVGGCTPGFEG